MIRRPRHIAVIACAVAAVVLSLVAARSYSRSSSLTICHRSLQWEIALHRGCIRLDNRPELDFEQRDLNRLQRIVDARSRAYLATMLDAPNLESRSPIELSQAATGVAASKNYAEAKRELARWQQIYATKPVSHAIHLAIPIAILLLSPLWQSLTWLRRRSRAKRCLCVACGYDIRATIDRCPECGLPVPTRSSTNHHSPEIDLTDFVRPSPMR